MRLVEYFRTYFSSGNPGFSMETVFDPYKRIRLN
jgi:hypothetical protein